MFSSRLARTGLAGLVIAVALLVPRAALGQARTLVLDQSFTQGNDLDAAINDCCNYIGQTFTAGRDGFLAGVNVQIYDSNETPLDKAPLRVSIRNAEEGLPGQRVLATTVLDSQNAPLSQLITFPEQPRVRSGVQYAIVVNLENPAPFDYAGWAGATGNRYPLGDQCLSFDDGFHWSCYTQEGFDVHFRTYVNTFPTSKSQCKNGGWRDFGFRNQGQCIRFVKHGPKW
jgi:hypothetical protein